MKQYSKIERYKMHSRNNNSSLFLFALTETVSVFNRVFRGINLQFMLMLEKMSTVRDTHITVNGKITSLIRDTNGSDLIQVGEGCTFRHIFTYKIKNKMNTNTAFVHEMTKTKSCGEARTRHLSPHYCTYIYKTDWNEIQRNKKA